MADLFINNESHYGEFITLNEQWISHYFSIEMSDIALAADPGVIARNGGFVLSLAEHGRVIGVCALLNQGDGHYELARLTVAEMYRRKGHADRLIKEAISVLQINGARKLYLLSNTQLKAALALYHKHGFKILSEGAHPEYSRCNLMMQRPIS